MTIPPLVATALGVALAAVTTLATIATIGIGFLVRPSRATLYWSAAFALAMVATFTSAAGTVADDETLRRAGLGALMGAPALLWSGFRVRWSLRPYAFFGPAIAVIAAGLLALPVPDSWYLVLYRGALLVAATFGGLFAADWARERERRLDPLIAPLAAASIVFVVLAVAVAATWFSRAPGMRDLEFARLTSSIGMLGYATCAAATIVAVAIRSAQAARRSAAVGDWESFRRDADERLHRLVRADEPVSLLYLQLDDVDEIRRSGGSSVISRLTRQFVAEVQQVFPSESLIDSPTPGTAVALITLDEADVRARLRTLLERISALDVDGRLPIHPSASAGWAPSSVVGYDLDALYYMAREAAVVASQDGGDRWERVGAVVTSRILSQSVRL